MVSFRHVWACSLSLFSLYAEKEEKRGSLQECATRRKYQWNQAEQILPYFNSLFANDSVFFLDGSLQECQNVAAVINQYCYASGQAINLNKSGIFFSKDCPPSLKENMMRELRVPELERIGKYLGIPSDWGASKKQMFGWIMNRINMKLESWKEQLISKAGKEILLKSVV